MHMRRLIGMVFLVLQLSMVIYAHFVPWRWFCWAPNDYMTEYKLDVIIAGRTLTRQEVLHRYRLPGYEFPEFAVIESPPANLIAMLTQYERTYGRNDYARVVLKYRANGREEKQWQWPAE